MKLRETKYPDPICYLLHVSNVITVQSFDFYYSYNHLFITSVYYSYNHLIVVVTFEEGPINEEDDLICPNITRIQCR